MIQDETYRVDSFKIRDLFNRKHLATRMNVKRAFGILKARFKEIGTKSSLKLDFLPIFIHCCCILHNILLASKLLVRTRYWIKS